VISEEIILSLYIYYYGFTFLFVYDIIIGVLQEQEKNTPFTPWIGTCCGLGSVGYC
jgi:hypothetical protein